MHRSFRWLALLSVALIATIGFFGISSAQDSTDRSQLRFVVVTHGQASDPFWSVVQNGVEQAGKDMGVKVEYQAPPTFDMVAMSQLIDAAVASKPDGLVVSIPDADALGPSIKAAVDAGIPVISMNSGSDVAAELGVLTHVGQTEYEAGLGAGERMGEAGVKNALCVNQEVGNVALDLRCQGFTDGLAKSGGTVEVLAVDLTDPTDAQQRIEAALTADSGHRRHPHPRPDRRRAGAGGADRVRPAGHDQAGHVRPLAGRAGGDRATATCSSPSTSSSTCRATCRSCC